MSAIDQIFGNFPAFGNANGVSARQIPPGDEQAFGNFLPSPDPVQAPAVISNVPRPPAVSLVKDEGPQPWMVSYIEPDPGVVGYIKDETPQMPMPDKVGFGDNEVPQPVDRRDEGPQPWMVSYIEPDPGVFGYIKDETPQAPMPDKVGFGDNEVPQMADRRDEGPQPWMVTYIKEDKRPSMGNVTHQAASAVEAPSRLSFASISATYANNALRTLLDVEALQKLV